MEDGDHDAAIVTLDAATRRLAASTGASRHDLGQGLLYLGVAYLAKGHELSAKARFREALAQEPDLKLNTDQFPPKVIEKLEEARAEIRAEMRVEKAGPSPAPVASPTTKKGGSKTPLILIGAGVAVAGGAAVAAGGGGSSATSTTTTPPSFRLDPADTQMFPTNGGSGGSPFAIACPSGSLANGYTGQTDSTRGTVTSIGLGCAALQPNGSTGAETTVSAGTGPGGQFTNRCPTGQVAVRLSGNFGSNPSGIVVVTQVTLACAPLSDWTSGGGAVTPLEGHGGSGLGRTPFSDTCSPGYVIVGLTGASGGDIDRVGFTCMRVRR